MVFVTFLITKDLIVQDIKIAISQSKPLQAINLHFFKCDFARRVICGDCVPNID
jgi:hypothetical protein